MTDLQGGNFNKYTVIKNEDAFSYLTAEQENNLKDILREIHACRSYDGKDTERTYLVINTDEPYADEVIEILKRHGHWG